MFSAQAAAHLRFNGIKIDRSVRNNTLYCSIFSNYKANACAGCESTLYMSDFCPSLLIRTNDYVTNQVVATPTSPNVGSMAYGGNTNRDRFGRMRVIHK